MDQLDLDNNGVMFVGKIIDIIICYWLIRYLFIQVFLVPGKRHKLTTHVKRKTLNPRWNETFVFEGKI